MPRFVAFMDDNRGKTVAVNVDHIVSVLPAGNDLAGTFIGLDNGASIRTKEAYVDVLERLREAQDG